MGKRASVKKIQTASTFFMFLPHYSQHALDAQYC